MEVVLFGEASRRVGDVEDGFLDPGALLKKSQCFLRVGLILLPYGGGDDEQGILGLALRLGEAAEARKAEVDELDVEV